jgi:hypothetical protein
MVASTTSHRKIAPEKGGAGSDAGRWYATHEDGSESDTGKVLVWEPPQRIILAWQINASWQFDPS